MPTAGSRLLLVHALFVIVIANSPASAIASSGASDQRVELKGRLTADGWIEARRIRLRDAGRGSKIEGQVVSIDVQRRRLDIGGLIIVVASDATIQHDDNRPGSLQDVRIGDVVEAKGKWAADMLDASRLRIRAPRPPGESTLDEVEIEADIEWFDKPHHFRVFGYAVGLSEGGKVTDERLPESTQESASGQRSGDRLRRDVDDQQVEPIRVGQWLTIGGRAGGDLWNQQSLSRDGETRDREGHAIAQLLGSATLGRNVELYTKIGASRAFMRQGVDTVAAGQPEVRLYEAYLAFGSQLPVGVQIGRQRFRDGREWFFDDYFDAVRVHLQLGAWRAETAIAEGVFGGPRELRSRVEQRHAIASLTKQLGRRSEAAAFVIARDDRSRDERPIWLGGEWNGRITDDVKSWTVGAVRRGESQAGRLGGWALDVGLAARLPVGGTPSFAAGYATASGDASGSDGVETRFRQTGLDDNRARLFGVKRFAQYGEVLDPELSNLTVLTFGAGFRPLSRTSVDLVYHRYVQRELRRSLPSNRLDAAGTGQSTDLGDAVDLILAVQQWRRVDLSIVLGVFRPGDAVTAPSGTIMYWKPEFRVFF